jgi:protein-tyrosine phosphatase
VNVAPEPSHGGVLFVCLGNICRSPIVEVVARDALARTGIDLAVASCGTGDWHVGKGADPRMVTAARAAGFDLGSHRARQLRVEDFDDHRWVLAMDRANLHELRRLCPPGHAGRLGLFLEQAGMDSPLEVPDPYFGDESGFHDVVALVRKGVEGWVNRLRTT